MSEHSTQDVAVPRLRSCRQASWLLSVGTQRPLTVRERAKLMLHLALCRPCRVFRREFRLLRAVMQKIVPRDLHTSVLEETLSETACERMQHALRAAQGAAEPD